LVIWGISERESNMRPSRRGGRLCGAASLGLVSTMVYWSTPSASADQVLLNGGYHAQTTDHWCAAASLEMMLDVPAVRNNNGIINQMMTVGDGPTVAAGDPAANIQIVNGVGTVTSRAQAFIYGLNHGVYTVNGMGYFNPNTPVGAGTDNLGIVTAANLLDNPNANGPAFPFPAVGHVYSGYNLAPTFAGALQASRTMANAMKDFSVPAQATVESGAHAICVYGVSTTGVIAANQNYTINGFYIHDPWTGYVASQLGGGNAVPLALGGWGLGWNTYLRYGYDIIPGGAPTLLPNGNVVNARLGAWFNYFNPSGGQRGATGFTTPGMKFTIEPQGPESLDTGDPANDGSLPTPPPLLGSEESNSQSHSAAIADLAADPTLSTEPGLVGGQFDSNLADEMLMPMPGDPAGEGDWLVPYDGSGGTNDVTGALMIDADTGVIDEATWIDPATDGLSSITLAQLDQMFNDQSTGLLPNDNPIPEPGSLTLLGMVGTSLLMRRRR
jgi:hypothetical protein